VFDIVLIIFNCLLLIFMQMGLHFFFLVI